MRKILLLTCGILMISNMTLAENTAETCADGAGTVVVGAVTGYKYCMSNKTMNWWNANTWCDALKLKTFELNDCGCSDVISNCAGNICAELALNLSPENSTSFKFEAWTNNYYSNGTQVHKIYTDTGKIRNGTDGVNHRTHGGYAVCK